MSPTSGNEHSNPLSRMFSKIFRHDDAARSAPPPKPQAQAAPPPAAPARPAATAASPTPSPARAQTQPTAAAVAPTPTATQRTYTVVAGDSLSKIAERVYGHADQWPRIFDANRATIHDPDLIRPGQVLVIPDASTLH